MKTASTGPSPAERARTILTRTASADVSGPDAPGEWSLRRLVLCPDPVPADRAGRPVEVEVADAAPLAVRERIRGRVRFAGSAVEEPDCDALHVHARTLTLVEDQRHELVVDDLLAADPDPLHAVEASMLSHLDASHTDVLETLTRLVDTRHRQGVVRVWPYRLDRHGLVLRLEYAQGHRDHRLSFFHPLASPQQLQHEMSLLIGHARHRVGPCAPTGLAPALRAAAAARRLCSPERDET